MRFADDVAERTRLDADWVRAHARAGALRAAASRGCIMPPPAGTAKNWAAYRARFVEPRRIDAGVRVLARQRADGWQRAEERFGVPADIVVGIVGVETFYGRITGSFRVIDALATLAFDFPSGPQRPQRVLPRRARAAFCAVRSAKGCDPLALKGSYAGAIGLPQFMPSSI